MEVASSGVWRFPEAEAVETDQGWIIDLVGRVENVLPLGVLRDDDWTNKPISLRASTDRILDDLREAVTEPDASRSARKVASHVRRYFAPEVCGRHGLPLWHLNRSRLCPQGQTDRAASLSVGHIRNLVNFLDALTDAVEQANHRRSP